MTTTVHHYDGFDNILTVGQLTEKTGYVTISGTTPSTTITDADGRGGVGKCVLLGSIWTFRRTVPAGATKAAGVAVKKMSNWTQGVTYVLGFLRGATLLAYLNNNSNGTFSVIDAAGTIVATFAAPSLGAYHYIEMKAYCHFSSGTVIVKYDGNIVANLTGVKTNSVAGEGTFDGCQMGGDASSGFAYQVDDWYVADDLVGDVACRWCPVAADGTYSQFTPLSSTNKSNVDDATPDDDTTYNSDGTSGHKDTYTLDGSNLPGSGTVVAVKSVFWARKDDVGDRLLVPTMRQASHDHDGTGDYLGLSYSFHQEISQVNPETSAAYTLSELTSSEFGYKVG